MLGSKTIIDLAYSKGGVIKSINIDYFPEPKSTIDFYFKVKTKKDISQRRQGNWMDKANLFHHICLNGQIKAEFTYPQPQDGNIIRVEFPNECVAIDYNERLKLK